MKLNINAINFSIEKNLDEFLQKKLAKLQVFHSKIINTEVYMKIENSSGKKDNKLVEIKICIPKHTLFSKEYAESFEAAIDEAVEGLRGQIRKYKNS